MKIRGLLKLSSRTYRARPLRTFLTVLGMSIGMSAVLFLVSLGYGLQAELLKRITTADTIYTLTVTVPTFDSEQVEPLSLSVVEGFEQMEGVAEVSGAKIAQGFSRLENVSSAVALYSIGEEYPRLAGLKLIAGSSLEESGSGEIVLVSVSVARSFNMEPEELVEKQLDVRSIRENNITGADTGEERGFRIAGVVDTSDNIVYVPETSSDFFTSDDVPYDEARVRAEGEDVMEMVRGNLLASGYDVSVIADIVRQVDTFFTIVQFILGFFGVIALIVSAVGMFNTMTVALLERTKEIGIMKSIGATDRYIALLFIIEAFTMGVLGGILGIAIAFAEMELINFVINIAASQLGGEKVDLFASPLWFLLLILGFSGIVGMMTGFIPARKASTLDPLQALQYK